MSPTYQDPYAPMARGPLPVPGPTLPTPRLARLGADDATIRIYEAWWKGLGVTDRLWAQATLAILDDSALADQATAVATLPAAGVREVMDWVRGFPEDQRDLAKGLALAAEDSRPEPRQSVYGKLGR